MEKRAPRLSRTGSPPRGHLLGSGRKVCGHSPAIDSVHPLHLCRRVTCDIECRQAHVVGDLDTGSMGFLKSLQLSTSQLFPTLEHITAFRKSVPDMFAHALLPVGPLCSWSLPSSASLVISLQRKARFLQSHCPCTGLPLSTAVASGNLRRHSEHPASPGRLSLGCQAFLGLQHWWCPATS